MHVYNRHFGPHHAGVHGGDYPLDEVVILLYQFVRECCNIFMPVRNIFLKKEVIDILFFSIFHSLYLAVNIAFPAYKQHISSI